MMEIIMGQDHPMFSMESDSMPKGETGSEVTLKAVIKKKSEYDRDGKTCYVVDYEVQSVDGQKSDEGDDSEAYEQGDDMETIDKLIDEEMSKPKRKSKTKDEE